MRIITEKEISERLKDAFVINEGRIKAKHNPCKNELCFVLCTIENILANLTEDDKNDKMIVQFLRILNNVSNENNEEYKCFLESFGIDKSAQESILEMERINKFQKPIIKEIVTSNLGEYWLKGDDKLCAYSAMKAFLIALYCILLNNYDCYFSHIDLIADLDDELVEVKLFEADEKPEHILLAWYSSNKIESMYLLYKTEYSGLEDESILDLVSADIIEEEYYLNDERFTIAPSILMKQYLAIIEREVNKIIVLSGKGNPDSSHLMWYDMKNRVRKKGINIDALPTKLSKVLDDLYPYRNDLMHGNTITNDAYKVMRKYKSEGLFKGLSMKKIELNGITLYPTVDEISEYL